MRQNTQPKSGTKQTSARERVIRCRYCTEGSNFKVMAAQGEPDTWYICATCGHLALPNNPTFRCTCAKCVERHSGRKLQRGVKY